MHSNIAKVGAETRLYKGDVARSTIQLYQIKAAIPPYMLHGVYYLKDMGSSSAFYTIPEDGTAPSNPHKYCRLSRGVTNAKSFLEIIKNIMFNIINKRNIIVHTHAVGDVVDDDLLVFRVASDPVQVACRLRCGL